MLVSDVVTPARRFLDDTTGDPRWIDDTLIEYCNDAEEEITRLRPDLLLDGSANTDVILSLTTLTALDDTMFFDEDFRPAIVNYLCFRALSEDNTDTRNSRVAEDFLARFEKIMKAKVV